MKCTRLPQGSALCTGIHSVTRGLRSKVQSHSRGRLCHILGCATIHLCHNSTDGFSRTRDRTPHSEAPSFRLQRAQRSFLHSLRLRALHCSWNRYHVAWPHVSSPLEALAGDDRAAWHIIFLAIHSVDSRHIAQRSDALEAELSFGCRAWSCALPLGCSRIDLGGLEPRKSRRRLPQPRRRRRSSEPGM